MTCMYRISARLLACALFLAAALTANAQTARFSGQVTDPQSAAIPGATVHVLNLDSANRVDTKTDSGGNFVVPYLPAGHYRLEVQASGFAAVVSDNVSLSVGEAHILNIQLGIAAEQTKVNVTASDVTQVH